MDPCNPNAYKGEPEMEELKNMPVYSLPVRIGNWNDELGLLEEKNRVASYKRNHCQLLAQRTRKMFQNLLYPVKLGKETPYMIYGETYQIKACDLPNKITPEEGYKRTYGLYLAGLMNESDIEFGTHFIHGCGISGSPDRAPCVRNTFQVHGCDGQSNGQVISYGEDIYIKIFETGTDGDLFIQCECATYDDFGFHLRLRLTQSPDLYCRFKVFHWHPDWRHETVGAGVPPNTRVIIQHTASGRNLACEYGKFIPSFFGAECTVACHTFKDTHKMETAENMWKFVSDQTPDLNVYVRAAKGEEIPVDLLI